MACGPSELAQPGRVNENQGAESTLALLIALLELCLTEQQERIWS